VSRLKSGFDRRGIYILIFYLKFEIRLVGLYTVMFGTAAEKDLRGRRHRKMGGRSGSRETF